MESRYALPVTLEIGPLMSAELISVPLNLDGKEVLIIKFLLVTNIALHLDGLIIHIWQVCLTHKFVYALKVH